jgi:hypothetical protein
MQRFIEEENRLQITLFPERADEYAAPAHPVRAVGR